MVRTETWPLVSQEASDTGVGQDMVMRREGEFGVMLNRLGWDMKEGLPGFQGAGLASVDSKGLY